MLSDIGGSVPNYFYYDGDQRRIITEDSGGRTCFLYDGEKVAVERNAAGTTQAAYVNQGPSIQGLRQQATEATNENHNPGPQLTLSLDFTYDVEEMEILVR